MVSVFGILPLGSGQCSLFLPRLLFRRHDYYGVKVMKRKGSGQGVRIRGNGGIWGSMVDILCCMELLGS